MNNKNNNLTFKDVFDEYINIMGPIQTKKRIKN